MLPRIMIVAGAAIILALAAVGAARLLGENFYSGDYLVFYESGRLATEGRATDVYDGDLLEMRQEARSPQRIPHALHYPPTVLLVLEPLGLLPMSAGIVLFAAAGLVCYYGALSLGNDFRAWGPIVLTLIPVATCVAFFQTTLLIAAALFAGLYLSRSRPWLAGLLLSLVSLKPQYFLIPFVALAVERNRRALGATTAGALGLAALTTVVFGFDVWRAYIDDMPEARRFLTNDAVFGLMVTPFGTLRAWGFPVGSSLAIQAVVSVVAFGAVVRRRLDIPMISLASVLAIPYAHIYDIVLLGPWLLAPSVPRLWREVGSLLPGLTLVLTPIAPAFLVAALCQRASAPGTVRLKEQELPSLT